MQQTARVPRKQGAVRLTSRDAVRQNSPRTLKTPQRRLGQRAEDPIRLQRTEARAVQGKLQQLNRGTGAPNAQNPHVIASFSQKYMQRRG